jgi:hypothetical protein
LLKREEWGVYRAERADGRFQRQVAIKVVPAALHSPELLRRFTSEQQILATLEHPNIAQFLDAGVSLEGIPYFVMEYVEGIPVNKYCDGCRRPTTVVPVNSDQIDTLGVGAHQLFSFRTCSNGRLRLPGRLVADPCHPSVRDPRVASSDRRPPALGQAS